MLSNREKSHICRYRHLSTQFRLYLRVLCASAFSAFQFLSSDNSPSPQSESSPILNLGCGQSPRWVSSVPLTSKIVKFSTKIRDQREQAIPTER